MSKKAKKRNKNLSDRETPNGLQKETPAINPPGDAWLGWLCLAAIISLAFCMNFHTLVDTDIFWHLKTGEIIFTTHQVPDKDVYSFTMAGKEWIDSQWLFQLVLFLLYRLSGYAGMIVVAAILNTLTWALIIGSAFKPQKYFLTIFFGAACILSASIRFKLRPEILSFLYIALEIFLISQFRAGEKYALYVMPLILLLWVNSEGIWPVYFVILSVFLFEDVLSLLNLRIRGYVRIAPKQSAARLGVCLLCSIPVAFINPYGYRGVVFPLTLFREVSSSGNYIHQTISDLQNPFTHLAPLERDVYIGLIVVSALFFIFLFYKRLLYPAAFILWAGFLFLSASALRNVALFGIVTCALVGMILVENYDREIFPARIFKINLLRLRPIGAAIIFLAAGFFIQDVATSRFFLRNGTHAKFGVGALETEYPIRGGDFLKSILTDQGKLTDLKIFADTESSAYFIWAGYPNWKVYFDPRIEVYGGQFLKNFIDALDSPKEFNWEDKQYDFDAVAVTSFESTIGMISGLYHDPQWSLVYLDGFSAIFLKNKPELAPVIQKYRLDFSKSLDSPIPADLTGKWLARERFCRGYILLMLSHPELALAEFEAGIKVVPDDPQMNYYLGWTLNIAQRFEEAKPYLERTAQKDPEAISNQIQLGRAYAMTGEPDRGIKIFEQVLAKNPHEITACMDIAKTYELILKRDDAYEKWQKCWSIYQTNPAFFKPMQDEISQALQRTQK